MVQWPKLLNAGLEEVDPELYDIIEHEKNRQYKVRRALEQGELAPGELLWTDPFDVAPAAAWPRARAGPGAHSI